MVWYFFSLPLRVSVVPHQALLSASVLLRYGTLECPTLCMSTTELRFSIRSLFFVFFFVKKIYGWGDPGARNNNIHNKSQKITTNHNKSHKITQNKYKKSQKKNSIHNKSQKITKITKNHKQSQKKNPIHKKSQKITNKKSYSQKITQNHKKINPIHKKSQAITKKKSYSQKITNNHKKSQKITKSGCDFL